MEDLFGFLVLIVLAAGTGTVLMVLHHWLGPKRSDAVHNQPFECGKDPIRILRGRFSVKFFLAALLFVLFDVELIFLFPWAVVYRSLGWFGFAEMAVFLLAVLAGLYYSVRKGALQWSR